LFRSIPSTCGFQKPLEILEDALDFVSSQLTSKEILEKLENISQCSWIDGETYFELVGDLDSSFDEVQCICSKLYTRGLVLVTIYFEGVFYVKIENGDGNQPLLDVTFPDVSREGHGATLATYDDDEFVGIGNWRKLSLWENPGHPALLPRASSPTIDMSSSSYTQTYCILKSGISGHNEQSEMKDVLFRFGSWVYSGQVKLISKLSLSDIPFVIPALRVQQGKLKYLSDISELSTKNVFAKPMEYASKVAATMESEVSNCENMIKDIISQLSSMGLAESANTWLNGDPEQTFFEFSFATDQESKSAHENVELIATKTYNPSGLITTSVYFGGAYYLTISEGCSEQPLLDSKFPNVSEKGRGYQIHSYPTGNKEWPQLRKLSIWQQASALENISEGIAEDKVPNVLSKSKTLHTNYFPDNSNDEKKDNSECIGNNESFPSRLDDAKNVDESTIISNHYSDSKGLHTDQNSSENNTGNNICNDKPLRRQVQTLGGVHHLAPMRKQSHLQAHMKDIHDSANKKDSCAVWDAFGKPVLKNPVSTDAK